MSVRIGIFALLFAVMAFSPFGAGKAQAATVEEMLTTIQSLMSQIETLQKQLNTIRGEVREVLRDGLKEGMTSEDIGKLQELLATDSSIYPEGLVTKFFGPLTKEAVKRFQTRHGLEITGEVNGETHDLLEEYLKESFGDKVPPGLLRAPGIIKKVELRYALGCEKKGVGMGPLCKKYKSSTTTSDNTGTSRFEVEVEIEDGDTTVSFEVAGTDYEVTATGTNISNVLEAVADELDKDVADLDSQLVKEIRNALKDAVAEVNSEAKLDAEKALKDAEDMIEEAAEAIEDANGDVSDAEDLLEDALELYSDAEAAFDIKDYSKAEELANEAAELAEDAIDAL